MKRITVFGGGATGHAVSAHLGMRGFDVCLCELPQNSQSISDAKASGALTIKGPKTDGVGKLGLVTTDLAQALAWSDQVIVCTISNRDEETAQAFAPHLRPGHTILLSAGNLGSYLFRQVFQRLGVEGVVVGETCGNLFPCRIVGKAQTAIGFEWSPKAAAAWPTGDTDRLLEAFKPFYELTRAPSILACALNSGNAMSHIGCVVLNAGAIQNSKGPYYMFQQGMAPCVMHVYDAMWEEKRQVMEALGYPAAPSLTNRFSKLMDPDFHDMDHFKNLEGPNSLEGRHLTEDVPILDCLMISVARAMGVEVPLFQALVKVASVINQTDYYKQGRTLENLGLSHLKGEALVKYFA